MARPGGAAQVTLSPPEAGTISEPVKAHLIAGFDVAGPCASPHVTLRPVALLGLPGQPRAEAHAYVAHRCLLGGTPPAHCQDLLAVITLSVQIEDATH